MQILGDIDDNRIHAKNYLVEMPLREYLDLSRTVIKGNEFQRKRVSSSSTIYSLLKDDFRKGCVIPPIVLALGMQSGELEKNGGLSIQVLETNVHSLVILDGLQRTYTLQDLVDEMRAANDPELEAILNRPIRAEIYVGLNRLGVLYRMLTLNTGQTPMSLRQQIEMLYLDFSRTAIDGVKLLKEVDEEAPSEIGEYSFKTVVEGFNSYIERNELPIDRFDLLESIKTLESLSREDVGSNLFPEFVSTYHKFILKLHIATNGNEYSSSELNIHGQPFGRDIRRIFSKSQAITGFGAAIGKLRDKGNVNSFSEVLSSIENMPIDNVDENINLLLRRLEQIRLQSKKIGNSQRLYFHFFFRQLLDPQADAYLKLGVAIETAFNRYETEMM
ncbi:hypothetical protein MCEMSEM22_01257 [Comamonadaceae bacterium]